MSLLKPPSVRSSVGAGSITVRLSTLLGLSLDPGTSPYASSSLQPFVLPVKKRREKVLADLPRIVIPRLHMSAWASYPCPRITSGAIQLGYMSGRTARIHSQSYSLSLQSCSAVSDPLPAFRDLLRRSRSRAPGRRIACPLRPVDLFQSASTGHSCLRRPQSPPGGSSRLLRLVGCPL